MKYIFCLFLFLVGCSSSEPKRTKIADGERVQIKDSKYGFQLKPFDEVEMPNGLKLILMHDDELPYVTLNLMVKSGSTSDPKDQEGLAMLMGGLLTRGTTSKKALEFADSVAHIGASIDVSTSVDHMMVTASGLSAHADALLDLFSDTVMHPAFSLDEISRLQRQTIAAIERQIDEPGSFTSVAWDRFIYRGHAYSRPSSGYLKSVRKISRKQIFQQYLKVVRPNNSYLSVVGRFTPEFVQSLKEKFGVWARREVPKGERGQVENIAQSQIWLVDKPGQVQSQVYIGRQGVNRSNPDFIKLRVANTILGGAFNSRLVNHVRKDKGLTYSIRSNFEFGMDAGSFEISTFTKNQTTADIVKESLIALRDFVEKGPTEDELNMAKNYLKGIFPQAIETPEKLSANLLVLRLYGISDSYLSTYLREVDNVTLEDVKRVASQYMTSDKIKILIYGSGSEIQNGLKTLNIPIEKISAQKLL